MQADGWYLRSDIIWHKPNPMPESVTDRPTSAHEHIFLLAKSARYFYDAEAVREANSNPDLAECITPRKDRSGNGEWQPGTGGRMGSVRDGRNLRNVWHLNPEPFPGAHFATMPATLAERCIKAGTSERGCCPHCGAPWSRDVERLTENMSNAAKAGTQIVGKGHPSSQIRSGHDIRNGPTSRVTTLGWSPSCACPERDPVPCTVLDPFAGAGTTLLVADRLQRHAVGIELNTDYCDLIRKRLAYESIPGLQRIVYVSVDELRLDMRVRSADGAWGDESVEGLEVSVLLPEIGIELPMAEIYEDTELVAKAGPQQ